MVRTGRFAVIGVTLMTLGYLEVRVIFQHCKEEELVLHSFVGNKLEGRSGWEFYPVGRHVVRQVNFSIFLLLGQLLH